MDKALENFGIFDFMGVWGPGAIIVTYFYFSFYYNFSSSMVFFGVVEPQISESYYILILATAVAYVVGVIFHELGKFVIEHLKLFETDMVKGLAYNDDANLDGWFGKIKKEYKTLVEKEIPNRQFYNRTNFNQANAYLKYVSKAGTKRVDKYHSICALSRSLFLCFFIHAVVALVFSFSQNDDIYYRIMVVDVMFAYLFWVRTYRYYCSWIRNTLVQYYHCMQFPQMQQK